ncbi:MAG: NAD-dependent DNA ligase LigA [Spirochaetales bacterium]|jgi:DNA ligase (NAD+)|nr:NAD-dependent DNA ligase LigA [Spirochaetales bacterium]
MDIVQAKREWEQLAQQLRVWQYEYYVKAAPSISDSEYDRVFDRLVALEHDYPELSVEDSPSKRVGSDLDSSFPEVSHSIAVLSLDKAYSDDAVLQWIDRCEQKGTRELSFVIEEKIDGISIVLYYEKGILKRAVTRGNGFVGNDVTANIKTIGSVPLSLPEEIDIAVRGEIYLERVDFDRLNKNSELPYANPRNLAAGTIRRNKSSEVAKVPLKIFVYEGFWSKSEEQPTHHVQILTELIRLGFRVNPSFAIFANTAIKAKELCGNIVTGSTITGSFTDLADYIHHATTNRKHLEYDIDGLVIKVGELAMREQLGYTGHHPRWAIAFKFEAPEALTTIQAIDVQVGRTGRITPVARVESVPIGGSVVSNITLHNQDYIDMLELSLQDVVAISKRGDVIPAVERVVEKNSSGNKTWNMPAHCPVCRTALITKGAHTFCPNTGCPDQVLGRIIFFVGRDQMDIAGLGPETVKYLVDNQCIKDIADLYTFDPDQLIGKAGFGEKKVALIKQGLAESRQKPFKYVLVSLGIPEFGKKAVDLLISSGISSIDKLLAIVDAGDSERLLAIKGFGQKTVDSLFEYLSDPVMRKRIEQLREAQLQFEQGKETAGPAQSHVFSGQTWCVTGSFEHFSPRSLALEEIEKRGGRTTGSVTGKTTHLLAGSGAGSKLDQALKLGITVVGEEDFISLLD